jgi:hypothetical protein
MKVIVLLPRRADLSPEAFKQHMQETHLPLQAAPIGRRGSLKEQVEGRSA